MIPLRDENPSSTTPFVTWTIVVLNVVVFLYELTLGPDLKRFMLEWGLVPERVSLGMREGESWLAIGLPFLTSTFLHGGWMHLLGNVWYLVIFGDNIEDRLGHFGYLVLYLLAGFAGGALHYFFNMGSAIPTVGASGAIAGVLGAYLIAFPKARIITLVPLFVIFQLMALPAVVVLGLWFVIQFFSGALSLAYSSAQGGGTAWWGHIGGFALGVVAMAFAGRRPRERARNQAA